MDDHCQNFRTLLDGRITLSSSTFIFRHHWVTVDCFYLFISYLYFKSHVQSMFDFFYKFRIVLYTDKDHWLKLFIRKLTWPTVANILATLPPISPFLDYLSCPLVYVFISTFCFLLVNLAVFDVLGVHSSFQSLEFSITFLRKQRMKMT